MKEESYFRELSEYFVNYSYEDIDDETLHKVRQSLINFLTGNIYATTHNQCEELINFITTINPMPSKARIWGSKKTYRAEIAAFANASRLSSMELNDGASASSHPGIYVWSAVLATYQEYDVKVEDVIRAVVFGYDICSRVAQRGIDKILELGLHAPGIVGGFGACAATALLRGLSVDEICNALGITSTLLPSCPFNSFIEGKDSKDFYGGWGVYMGMLAVEAAKQGLTGPEYVFSGIKSMGGVFNSDKSVDVKPGEYFFINKLSIKYCPTCFAVVPAIVTVQKINKNHKVNIDDIESILVESYPYSYDLNEGVGRNLNSTSGRLSLYYTVAYTLYEGEVTPDAFLKETMAKEKYQKLMNKITTKKHVEYGTGESGVRGCIVTLYMKDKSIVKEEVDASKHIVAFDDKGLYKRYLSLATEVKNTKVLDELFDNALSLNKDSNLGLILDTLVKIDSL